MADEEFQSDLTELLELESLLYRLPDSVIAGKCMLGAQYRARMSAVLKLLGDLVTEVQLHPVGVTRARLVATLARWRASRARYADLMALRQSRGDPGPAA
jgi:hypothetical protein